MSISIRLVDSPTKIEKDILKALADGMYRAIIKSVGKLSTSIAPAIKDAIFDSEELKSLQGGVLQYQLGLTSSLAGGMRNQIADASAISVELSVKKVSVSGNKFNGGLTIYIQPTNFANLLNLGGSSYDYYSRTYKETVTINWLDWLLTQGDKILVGKFRFVRDFGSGSSGGGKMKKGGSWRVPPEFSGTITDNFITRAINDKQMIKKLVKILSNEIEKSWS